MSTENDPIVVVQRYRASRLTGDTSAAKALWADGAMWHLTGSHSRAGDYSFDDDMDMIAEWVAAFPGYSAETTCIGRTRPAAAPTRQAGYGT